MILGLSPVGLRDEFHIVQEDDAYGGRKACCAMHADLNNEEAHLSQNLMEKIGVYQALADLNVPDGATVRVGELEFQYMEWGTEHAEQQASVSAPLK